MADIGAIALLAAIAAAVLADALFGGRVLLPAELLRHVSPWSSGISTAERPPPWNPLMWDGVAQFYPWRRFAAEWVSRGILPLWNPHQFCGTPFFANSQSALFYPVNALFYLPGALNTAERFAWIALIHLTLAGSGTYGWLRAIGAGHPGAFLAGATFMLSGFAVTWLALPTLLSVACWIPFLLLAIHQTLTRRSLRWALLAGLALGLMLLGGHLQIAFYGLVIAGVYALFLVCAGRAERGNLRAALRAELAFVGVAAIMAAAIGFALAAPQLLPAVEMSRFSHRAGAPTWEGYRAYVNYAVPLGHLVTLFLPDFYGNPRQSGYWGAANYAEYCGYTGVVTLFLALVAVVGGWRRHRTVLFLAGSALLSLVMAAGAPINALFYFGIPGFGQSGSPGRILVLFCLSTSALAGLGLDWILGSARERMGDGRRIAWSLGAAVLLWALAFLATRSAAGAFLTRFPGLDASVAWRESAPALRLALVLLIVGAGALAAGIAGTRSGVLSPTLAGALTAGVPVLVIVADLGLFATGYLLTAPPAAVYPSVTLTERLQRAELEAGGRILPVNRTWSLTRPPVALLPPNAAMVYGLHDAQGYDSLYLRRFKALANAIQGADTSPAENGNMLFLSNVSSPLFPLLGIRHIVSRGPLSEPPGRAETVGDVTITEDARALPLAFLVHRWRSVTDPDALSALAELAASNPTALQNEAVLSLGGRTEGRVEPHPQAPSTAAPVSTGASLVGRSSPATGAWSPNRVRVAVRAPRAGLLVVTGNHYPGWIATLRQDGHVQTPPVLRADHTFRGVLVPAGSSEVEMRFEPASLRVGLFLSLLAVSALGGIAASRRRGYGTTVERTDHAAISSP
jgi:hypothetical protein